MSTSIRVTSIASLFLMVLVGTGIAQAEKADQDKPIILEAEQVSVNDVQQIYDLKVSSQALVGAHSDEAFATKWPVDLPPLFR